MGAHQGVQGSLCFLPCLPAPSSPASGALSLPLCSRSSLSLLRSRTLLGPAPDQKTSPVSCLAKAVCSQNCSLSSYFSKQCVFNQFYNKTQTEFLRTTAKRNNKIIPAPAATWAQPSSLSENLPPQACSSWLPSCLNIPKLPPHPLSFSISGQPCPLPTPLPASHLTPLQNGPKVSPGGCSKRQIYLQ